MNSLIIDLQYFANVNWFKKAYNYKHVYLSKYEMHAKMSFRNRTMIAGADGPLRLTVPIVDGRNERQFYKDVKTVDGRWRLEHFRAIASCYNRSPWFEYYRDELADLYKMPFANLFEWNLACQNWVVEKIGLGNPFIIVEKEEEIRDSTIFPFMEMDNAVNEFHPGSDGGLLYITSNYTQVFHEKTGFIAGLSILDLLFCKGPSAKNLLRPGS
ncbi:WbqC family protein [Flavihumibacter sp. UBA7668]|uniref:WbqC family protein n=1 Tax=Flavihumibacter sp. UBA7668 TaxID=1946542 RepID=UPI0025B91FCD|nr:WbqC family protein [Flavihumibacter sp. UBA7668]